MQSKGYEAYKYVMADTSYLYLGAKYSYQEIIENEEVPFKVKAIMERYILTSGMDKDTTWKVISIICPLLVLNTRPICR